MAIWQFPSGSYIGEQGYSIRMYAKEYSVLAGQRTRNAIAAAPFHTITLPIPGNLVTQTQHGYSEEANPVGPMLTAAGALNSGGTANLLKRVFIDPMLTYFSNISSTTTLIKKPLCQFGWLLCWMYSFLSVILLHSMMT